MHVIGHPLVEGHLFQQGDRCRFRPDDREPLEATVLAAVPSGTTGLDMAAWLVQLDNGNIAAIRGSELVKFPAIATSSD